MVLPGVVDGSEAAWLCGDWRNEVEGERAPAGGSSAPTEPEHLTPLGILELQRGYVSEEGVQPGKIDQRPAQRSLRWYCHQMTGTRMCHALSFALRKDMDQSVQILLEWR